MRRVAVRGVADATGALLIRGDADQALDGFSTDSRALRSGEIFIALSGPNFDGNRFARAAIEAGAGALLLRGDEADAAEHVHLPGAAPILLHPDPRRALGDLASWHRSHYDVPVLGITGSCGKTTVKNIVTELLGTRMPFVSSPSSFNNDIGVPHTLLLGDEDTKLFVVEIGTNQRGEIATLCRIARPTAGVITNIGASHLEGLGSLEGVAQEKGDLAAAIPREGFLVLNADCRFLPELSGRTSAEVITFSTSGSGADLEASDIVFHAGGTTFRLNGVEVTSPLLGTHNVQNLLAALCVCRGLGIPVDEVLPAVSTLRGGSQRMERVQLDGISLFDDSYNSNPDSSRAAVRFLSGLHGHARRVLVLGDMLELGDFGAEMHHALGALAARSGIDLLVLAGELTKAAAAGALEAGMPEGAVVHLETTEQATQDVPALLRDGDVVLVKGSRGMQLERVVRAIVQSRGPAED
ncbi:MAG: UDP-N-acetylmuramoyl-tripeptide--D-alanyl-D-alanine ligase [Planctomycetota bacterium]